MIIARIESLILEAGMDDALTRANAYIKAGADGIMIHSRHKDPAEIIEFMSKFRAKDQSPVVVVPQFNSVTIEEFIEMGVNVVVTANHMLRSAYPAMLKVATSVLKNGRTLEAEPDCMSIKEILEFIPGTKTSLNTKSFIDTLIQNQYTHLCVVPCSFAKYVINEAINNDGIEYLPAASEAVACSIAAGLKMAGKKPIVIVQSSGMTNMGSCITSLIKPYGVTFPILTSWRSYKEGDSEIQHKHLATELPKLINAYGYEHCILDNQNLENAISQINDCNESNIICIIEKDSFEKADLHDKHQLDLSNYIPRSEFLIGLNQEFSGTDTLFIGTTGNAAREMYSFMPDTNNFYMAGNMGGALSVGFGAAKAGKKLLFVVVMLNL